MPTNPAPPGRLKKLGPWALVAIGFYILTETYDNYKKSDSKLGNFQFTGDENVIVSGSGLVQRTYKIRGNINPGTAFIGATTNGFWKYKIIVENPPGFRGEQGQQGPVAVLLSNAEKEKAWTDTSNVSENIRVSFGEFSNNNRSIDVNVKLEFILMNEKQEEEDRRELKVTVEVSPPPP